MMHGPVDLRKFSTTKLIDASTSSPRAYPHNIEVEQALLGAILINNDALDRIGDNINAEHFYDPIHGRIFAAIQSGVQSGGRVTPVTLAPFFASDPHIGTVTIPQYMGMLAANATSILNAPDYAKTIYELWVRRQLVELAEDMNTHAYEVTPEYPPSAQIEDAETRLFGMAERNKYGKGFREFDTALNEAIEKACTARNRDGGLSGISTGLADLDRLTGGLHASDLIILAGRPAMGKTSLATNIAFNVAKGIGTLDVNRGVVGFFSLEMSAEQLATRIISEKAEVSSESIRRGMVRDDELERICNTRATLRGLPLHIDDTGGISISQLSARARRLKRQHGLELIVVDYLQLLTGAATSGYSNRVQEITQITVGLKALAKEMNVPVIALSQLSRKVEEREDKHPLLSDLRESGSIEQDADVVMFVYREEYYLAMAEPKESDTQRHMEWRDAMGAANGVAEVIIAKQRHGPTGTAKLQFTGKFTRFSDLARSNDS